MNVRNARRHRWRSTAGSTAVLAAFLLTACRSQVMEGPTPIPAPTDLQVSDAYRAYQIDVRWANACWDCSRFELQARTSGEDWVLIANIPAGTLGVSLAADPNAPELSQIFFRIRAVRTGDRPTGASDWSNEAVYTFPIRAPGLAVVSSSGPMSQTSWVELELWNNSQIADTVVLERATSRWSGSWTALPVAFGQRSFRDEDVRELDGYAYRVRYGTGGAWSGWGEASAEIPLRQPSDVRASVASGVVQVSWTNWSAAATGVVVRASRLSGVTEAALPADASSWTDPVSPPWPTTTYQVEATSPAGPSAAWYALPVAKLDPFRISGPAATLDARAYDLPVHVTARDESGAFYGTAFDAITGLSLARQVGTSWDLHVTGAADTIVSPGVTLDAAGHPHAVVRGPAAAGLAMLTHHWYDGTSWREEDLGMLPSSARTLWCGFDADGAPQVAYEQVMPWQLFHGSASAGAWVWAPVSGVRGDMGFSFAVAPDGTAYILGEGALATLTPGSTWTTDAMTAVVSGTIIPISGSAVAVIGPDTNVGAAQTYVYVERRDGPWSVPETMFQVSVGEEISLAASADGARIDAVARPLGAERVELHRREAGAWSSMPLVGTRDGAFFSLGYSPASKLWIEALGSLWEEP